MDLVNDMSTYGWVLVLSVIFPIIFSFHPKIDFYKKWKTTVGAIFVVAIPFWVWDAVATQRGDWSFNKLHVGQFKIAGMPIEEVMFFIVIPFCCLFIWQIIEKFVKDKKICGSSRAWVILTVVAMCLALVARDKYYTSTILWWSVITVPVTAWLSKDLFFKLNYWKWIGITFVPFLIVNGVLTYLPIVEYSSEAITGVRVGSIPIEDFLYSWSLLTLNLVVYKKLGSKITNG